MKIVQALLALLETVGFPDEEKARIGNFIDAASVGMTLDPRDEVESNGKFLHASLLVIARKVEDLYGAGDDTDLHYLPIFLNQLNSQILPLIGEPKKFALGIGLIARSWEDVFYELCHESLHSLNPVVDVRNNRVAALEEGCAVKFAEQMYLEYIKPYCNEIPLSSPVSDHSSQYFTAYMAAKKIPDNVLRKVRQVFGRFSKIDDVRKFTTLVELYVSEAEAASLCERFVYR
ncbi:TPA: hypothetical protein RKT01_004472 [Burkholderia vietnamiensis]|nr:hypothetical protein [Burkholderia vietnamiensis]